MATTYSNDSKVAAAIATRLDWPRSDLPMYMSYIGDATSGFRCLGSVVFVPTWAALTGAAVALAIMALAIWTTQNRSD